MEAPPGSKLGRRGTAIKKEIWFIDQFFSSSKDLIEIFIGGPFIFVEEEIFRWRVLISRIEETIKQGVVGSNPMAYISGYDLNIPVADAIQEKGFLGKQTISGKYA